MTHQIASIPNMLKKLKYNRSELSRILHVERATIKKYEDDTDGRHHVVLNGVLMTETRSKRSSNANFATESPR